MMSWNSLPMLYPCTIDQYLPFMIVFIMELPSKTRYLTSMATCTLTISSNGCKWWKTFSITRKFQSTNMLGWWFWNYREVHSFGGDKLRATNAEKGGPKFGHSHICASCYGLFFLSSGLCWNPLPVILALPTAEPHCLWVHWRILSSQCPH